MNWYCKAFNELSTHELYQILALRAAVFVVEQQCIYQDVDDHDQECWHVFAKQDNDVLAYARILPAGVSYDAVSFGRVAVATESRGKGLGQVLIQKTLSEIAVLLGDVPIQIGAQAYLQDFYQKFGFQAVSEVYLEDGIAHVDMLRA